METSIGNHQPYAIAMKSKFTWVISIKSEGKMIRTFKTLLVTLMVAASMAGQSFAQTKAKIDPQLFLFDV